MNAGVAGFGPPPVSGVGGCPLATHQGMRPLLLAVLLASGSVLAADPVTKAVPAKKAAVVKQGLEAPSYLSAIARQLLKKRMQRHGTDMLAMVTAVIFLDHETTQRLAAELAAEPRLTRPIAGGADDVNAALPEQNL